MKFEENNDKESIFPWIVLPPFNTISFPILFFLAIVAVFVLGNLWLFFLTIFLIIIILFFKIRKDYRKSKNKGISIFLSILIIIALIFTMIILYKFSEIIRETGIY